MRRWSARDDRPRDVIGRAAQELRCGLDGPIRGNVKGAVDPIGEGERSRVTLELDFEGHGIGKLLVPLVVRRLAQKEMPKNLQTLKERLEGGA